MMRIDLEGGRYVDMILIPPMAPLFDCAVRLEFSEQDFPELGTTKAFSIGTDQLGAFIDFLQAHPEKEFFEFKSEPRMTDGERTIFRFKTGGEFLTVTDKGVTVMIPMHFRRIVLLEALKHYCAEVFRG